MTQLQQVKHDLEILMADGEILRNKEQDTYARGYWSGQVALAKLMMETIERMESNNMIKVINMSGTEINWDSAFELMDEIIANEISMKLSPCTEQEMMAAYEVAHLKTFGEVWELSKTNPVY